MSSKSSIIPKLNGIEKGIANPLTGKIDQLIKLIVSTFYIEVKICEEDKFTTIKHDKGTFKNNLDDKSMTKK